MKYLPAFLAVNDDEQSMLAGWLDERALDREAIIK